MARNYIDMGGSLENIDKRSVLWKTYTAFLENSPLNMSEEDLIRCAKVELKLKFETFPPIVAENLPAIMIAFMNRWSGWQFSKAYIVNAQLSEKEFKIRFLRFKKFLLFKINTLRTDSVLDKLSKSLEIGPFSKTETFPWAISIQCPAAYASNGLAFFEENDDIVMNYKNGTSKLKYSSTTQLINLPHVEVSFETEDIYFFRRQVTEYIRYLNVNFNDFVQTQNSTIDHVEQLATRRFCYSYNYFNYYFKEYLGTLRQIKVPKKRVEEIHSILNQFLQDIDFLDINKSIVTNSIIRFHLSKYPYVRNAKSEQQLLSVKNDSEIGLTEILNPKIEMSLLSFSACPIQSSGHFQYLEKLKEQYSIGPFNESCLPHIHYKCTFCNIIFKTVNAKDQLIQHISTHHRRESQVLCRRCSTSFDVYQLATSRWHHKCSPEST